jgi:hypothetical protein
MFINYFALEHCGSVFSVFFLEGSCALFSGSMERGKLERRCKKKTKFVKKLEPPFVLSCGV